jgi:thioredoxin-related protein
MKRSVLLCLLCGLALPALADQVQWLTDSQAALDQARREHKFVMLDFTGSDWCGWCMKLKREVFDQPEFATFANANLVLVEVDFPRDKPQSQALRDANENLSRTYHIAGYPTIIVLDQNATQVGQAGYVPGGPGAFIAELERIPGMTHVDLSAPGSGQRGPQTRRQLPALIPAGSGVITHYDYLELKAVSGGQNRRMALINNETFMVGEKNKVKVKDQHVEIFCKEIRSDSVLITADGKVMELKLAGR